MEVFCSVLGISSHFGNPSSISDFCDFLKIFGKSKPFMTISDLEMKRGQFTVGVADVIVIFGSGSKPVWRYNIVFPM